jgi:hypothetical protein
MPASSSVTDVQGMTVHTLAKATEGVHGCSLALGLVAEAELMRQAVYPRDSGTVGVTLMCTDVDDGVATRSSLSSDSDMGEVDCDMLDVASLLLLLLLLSALPNGERSTMGARRTRCRRGNGVQR